MYNTELNAIIDATEQGKKIKRQFNLCVSYVTKLNEFTAEARDKNGDLTSPVMSILSEDQQTEIKAFLNAIQSANNVYLSAMERL